MQIGDSNHESMVELRLSPGTICRVLEGGNLKVTENSHLILEKGSTLIIDNGNFEMLNGAILTIEKGAKLIYKGGEFLIDGPDCEMILKGEIRVEDGVEFSPIFNEEAPGTIRIYGDHHQFTGPGYFYLKSNDSDVPFVYLSDDCILKFNWEVYKVSFDHAKVEFGQNAMISPESVTLQAYDSHFTSEEFCEGFYLEGGNEFKDCRFQDIPIVCDFNSETLRITDSEFFGPRSTIEQTGGRYMLFGCFFYEVPENDIAVTSSFLTGFSRIRGSKFLDREKIAKQLKMNRMSLSIFINQSFMIYH